MTWPTNKADESKLANDTDNISQARKQIKQNVDNVNAIINHFDLSTISEGDVIRYVSGQWQVIDGTAINSTTMGSFKFDDANNVSSADSGNSSIFTTDTAGSVYLLPGQYIIHSVGYMPTFLAPGTAGTSNTYSFTIGSKSFSFDSVCYEGGNTRGVQRNVMSGLIGPTTNQLISTTDGANIDTMTILVYKIA